MKSIVITLISLCLISCNETQTPVRKENRICIGLQPFEVFNKVLLDTIQNTIKEVYGFSVIVLPPVEFPDNAYINIKTPRYRADTLLVFLSANIPDSVNFIMGLTHKDISTTNRDKKGNIKQPEYKYTDWGIFGLGYRPGPSCIISTKRIKHADYTLYIERVKKISIHELGHNLGLKHCPSPKCVMQDACETIKTVDNVELVLCENCKMKLKSKELLFSLIYL